MLGCEALSRRCHLTQQRDRSFLIAEIAGDSLYFQAVSRKGAVVDKGVIARREAR